MVFDVHLMLDNPLRYIEEFIACGADIVTVHAEIEENISEIVNLIHSKNKKAGLAIKPKTPLSAIEGYINDFDMFLFMTVEPGFGGQKYIPDVTGKIKQFRDKVSKIDSPRIEVDGGITAENINIPAEAGADVFVAGSSIFGSSDPKDVMIRMRRACGL
jgi:ribulose-phosphate 3-epimerase